MTRQKDKKNKDKDLAKGLDPRIGMEGRKARVLSREVFYKGQTILRQGDLGYRAYFIERGQIEIVVADAGKQLKIAEMGPGEVFGEMSLINDEPRSATVTALDDCVLTVISKDEMEGKMEGIDDPAIRALLSVLARRLRDSTKGQLNQYVSLADFQDRMSGIVDGVEKGVDESRRAAFRAEVMPLLDRLEKVLTQYKAVI